MIAGPSSVIDAMRVNQLVSEYPTSKDQIAAYFPELVMLELQVVN